MSDPQPESNPIDPTVEEPALSSEISPPVAVAVPPKREKRTFRPKPRVSPQVTSPYAVIETGGKQYRVSVGDTITVERLPDDAGDELSIDRVLLLGGDGSTRIGTPTVEGALVTAKIDDHFRGEKIVVFKYKAKKRYRRRTGHRQSLTHLTITNIAS